MKKDTGLGLKKLADHSALRAAVLVAVLLLAAYTSFFRLGDEDWRTDEQTYQKAGLAYVRDGNFNPNQEHPFLPSTSSALPRFSPAPQKRGWFGYPQQRPPSSPALCSSPSPGGWRATGLGLWRWPCGRSLPLPLLLGGMRPSRSF